MKSMPESQEVRLIADYCHQNFSGKQLISYNILQSSKFIKHPIKNIELLNREGGWYLENVSSHGKKIIFKLTSPESKLYILSSLGMEGRWSSTAGKHSDFCLIFRKIDSLEDILWYDDSRHFGNIEIHDEESYKKRMEKIGPDIYKDNVTVEQFINKIRNPRLRKTIFPFLMDQKQFSGLGAYLTAESLYLSKLSPHRTLKSLSDRDIISLFYSIKEILRIASQSNGLTIKSFKTPDGHIGTFPCKVYGKMVDPNGNKVIKSVFQQRTCWWVKEIQI